MKKKKLLLLLGTIALGMILLIGVGGYKMHKAKLEKSAIELEEKQAQREAEREEQDRLENNTVANELNKKTSTNNNSLAGLDRIERAKQVAKDYIGPKNASVYYIDLTSGKSFGIN